MPEGTTNPLPPAHSPRHEGAAIWFVRLAQLLFVLVALLDLDGPFLSAHNERQNQSFDMARHVYRDGWRSVITPKVSYVFEGYESLPYTAALQEVPFNGIIMWPLAHLTGHERALARLVAVAFSLIAIELLYRILRTWLPPGPCATAAFLFALSPLLLHFGQVPMPDIISTAGMLAAFLYALRGRLAGSSALFAFAILAKSSVIVFGLPILIALLIQRQCQSLPQIIRTAIFWGWLPLACLVAWMTAITFAAPPSPMTISALVRERGHWDSLLRPRFYVEMLGPLFVFGTGVLGFIGLLLAPRDKTAGIDRRIKLAIVISILVFLLGIFRKAAEPQYILEILPWVMLGAAFGLNYLFEQWRSSGRWRAAILAGLALHALVAVAFTIDLKAWRVREYDNILQAAKLLPPDARVIVVYRYYGAGPAVWLDRNVLALGQIQSLESFDKLHKEGFDYALLLDIGSWHDDASNDSPLALASRLLHINRKATDLKADPAYFTGPDSAFRKICDQRLKLIFAAPRVVLYSIPPRPPAPGKS